MSLHNAVVADPITNQAISAERPDQTRVVEMRVRSRRGGESGGVKDLPVGDNLIEVTARISLSVKKVTVAWREREQTIRPESGVELTR
jgi:hypothetical protein